jgi:brefeldin A-resistance guanine nucleotide exchange factor 1
MTIDYGGAPVSSGTVAVSRKHVLLSEILSVTSVMRKNSRWASSTNSYAGHDSDLAASFGLRVSAPSPSISTAVRGSREKDLMAGFQVLKRTVNETEGKHRFDRVLLLPPTNLGMPLDLATLELPNILAPFFAIIRSPLSTGPITSTALAALHNFFVTSFINEKSIQLDAALVELSTTVSNCKFEASDSSGDEVVMLKIMTVIEDCMCGSVGGLLGDVEVCEMLETVLTTCCQMRLSGQPFFLLNDVQGLNNVSRDSSPLGRTHNALHCPSHVFEAPLS